MIMKRAEARELAVRLCFMLSENPMDADELLSGFFDDEHYESLGKEDELFTQRPGKQIEYISTVIRGIALHNAELDDYIAVYSKGWDFSRISRTALAIMKLAMYEILYIPDIPERVSINEAVELAKKYDEPETVPFINGILGSFLKGEAIQE